MLITWNCVLGFDFHFYFNYPQLVNAVCVSNLHVSVLCMVQFQCCLHIEWIYIGNSQCVGIGMGRWTNKNICCHALTTACLKNSCGIYFKIVLTVCMLRYHGYRMLISVFPHIFPLSPRKSYHSLITHGSYISIPLITNPNFWNVGQRSRKQYGYTKIYV